MIGTDIIKIALDTNNCGIKNNSNLIAISKNKICGDKITVEIEVNKNKIERMYYETESCVFCQASASLLSNLIKRTNIKNLRDDLNQINTSYKKKKLFLRENTSHLGNYFNKNTKKDLIVYFYLLMPY
tara:strand:+ start:3949 stop:4332 length:384 start_codon:yes stop_codon:yes gene_type:complete